MYNITYDIKYIYCKDVWSFDAIIKKGLKFNDLK